MWSKWQKHPRQVLMKSTVIPIWHDIAKQGDWSVGSILQWQLQSCESWLPTRKCTGRLKAVCQQVLKFCSDLTACYQLSLCITAALLHRDSVRVCLCWIWMLEKVHGHMRTTRVAIVLMEWIPAREPSVSWENCHSSALSMSEFLYMKTQRLYFLLLYMFTSTF